MTCVRGNHDRWAARDAKLSPAALSLLGSLPAIWRATIDGVRVVVCHGTPRSDMDPIFASDANAAMVRSLLDSAEADVLVLGHSHGQVHLTLEKAVYATGRDGTVVVEAALTGSARSGTR